MSIHDDMMRLALKEAQVAALEGEVPVGAVIARGETLLAKAHNQRETLNDPTAHAEILAIREAARVLGNRRLSDCTLYVTLEPCPMCAGAIVMACLGKCYFAAADQRQGCAESVYALTQDPAFYHHTPCIGGLMESQASALLDDFFAKKR
ncbi:MAG: nucleoside deaminase [Clostridiales bacterium]|nr:nucleoside deaminase [Clostridiales bacterium]